MTPSTLRLVIPALLGLGLVGVAATSGHADTTSNGPVRCGIQAVTANGMQSLQATLLSDVAVSGSYQFNLKSSGPGGSSNISQGGAFAANANDPVTLGRVSINSNATYQIAFDVTANGVTLDCAKQVAELR